MDILRDIPTFDLRECRDLSFFAQTKPGSFREISISKELIVGIGISPTTLLLTGYSFIQ